MENKGIRAALTRPDGLSTQLKAARGALSMSQLATKLGAGWSSSRVSKIETGRQLPTTADVESWAEAVGKPNKVREWTKLAEEAAALRSTTWRRSTPDRSLAGTRDNDLEAVATVARVAQMNTIPDLLQTEGYTRSALRHLDAASRERIVNELHDRQTLLRKRDRKFLFLIGESALRTIVVEPQIMAEQLDRLISAASLAGVTLAVLPQGALLEVSPLPAPVAVYDEDAAVVTDGIEDRRYEGTVAKELAQRFDVLWAEAVTGPRARKIILSAIDALPGN